MLSGSDSCICLFVGQDMPPHHSDQMSQMSPRVFFKTDSFSDNFTYKAVLGQQKNTYPFDYQYVGVKGPLMR